MIRRILIPISYALTLAVVLTGTIMLVELGQGYSYDLKSGQFYINGLLSLVSSPSSANLIINGKATRHNTPYRNTLKTGTYNIELRKRGFHSWSKQVDILPFQVLSLELVFLVPTNIVKNDLTPNQTATHLVASRDRRHFAYRVVDPTTSIESVWVVNGNRGPGSKVYSASPATEARGAEAIAEVAWAADSSHILVRSDAGGTPIYSLVSASGGSPVNLTDLFKLDLSGLQFSPYDWRELYWNSGGSLRRMNAGDRTVSAVLTDKVSGFSFAGDRILYVRATPLGKSLWSMDRSGNNQKQLIESLADSGSYQLSYANYRGLDALAVLPEGTATVTLYLDIFSANPVSKVVSKSASRISFSENSRYLAFSSDSGFGTYDLEKNTILLAPKVASSCLNWFDNYHFVLCRQNQVYITELDGANMTKIADIAPGSPAYGYGDMKRIISVGPVQKAPSVVFSAQVKQ
jgi:hypothetical protein